MSYEELKNAVDNKLIDDKRDVPIWTLLDGNNVNLNLDKIRLLIESGYDPSLTKQWFNLNNAIEGKGTALLLQLLVDSGLDVNNAQGGYYPLFKACDMRNIEALHFLLSQRGIDFSVTDNDKTIFDYWEDFKPYYTSREDMVDKVSAMVKLSNSSSEMKNQKTFQKADDKTTQIRILKDRIISSFRNDASSASKTIEHLEQLVKYDDTFNLATSLIYDQPLLDTVCNIVMLDEIRNFSAFNELLTYLSGKVGIDTNVRIYSRPTEVMHLAEFCTAKGNIKGFQSLVENGCNITIRHRFFQRSLCKDMQAAIIDDYPTVKFEMKNTYELLRQHLSSDVTGLVLQYLSRKEDNVDLTINQAKEETEAEAKDIYNRGCIGIFDRLYRSSISLDTSNSIVMDRDVKLSLFISNMLSTHNEIASKGIQCLSSSTDNSIFRKTKYELLIDLENELACQVKKGAEKLAEIVTAVLARLEAICSVRQAVCKRLPESEKLDAFDEVINKKIDVCKDLLKELKVSDKNEVVSIGSKNVTSSMSNQVRMHV